jgi:hypothetical protein
MKKSLGALAAALSFVFLSALLYLNIHSSLSEAPGQLRAAKHLNPAPLALQVQESASSQRSSGYVTVSDHEAVTSKVESESDFNILLSNANLSTTLSVAKTTEVLRSADPAKIAKFFSRSLEVLAQKDSDQRERLVFVANELQSDQLLGFWQDIALRNPARFEDETKYLDFGEPTEELLSIHQELMNSIRNIGLIASRDSRASDFLSNLILHPSSPLHDDFLRERAFISLKEADLAASIRVLKLLDKSDSLRDRLINR